MEGKCCHGDAIDQLETISENILGGSYSLKAKL
jgi:hypothetical protein